MHEKLELRLLRDTASLEALEPEWRALWQSDPHATPFQTPEWLLPWWRQFSQPELTAVTIRRTGKLIGFLPFYIYREPVSGRRQLLLIGAGTSDYLDGVFAPDCTPEHVGCALHLLVDSVSWDQGCATQLRPGSRLLATLTFASRPFPTECCWRMPAVPASALPRKIRQNVAQRTNRALREGPVEYALADVSTCRTDFDALVSLHSERWQSRGEGGVFHDPRVLAWHQEAVPRLASVGLLTLFSLRRRGETMAAMYCLADPPGKTSRSLYVYIPAFSPRYAKLSPGTLLLAHAVEHAAAEGMSTVDLLRGNERYKQLWHMEAAPTFGCNVPHARSAASPLREAA